MATAIVVVHLLTGNIVHLQAQQVEYPEDVKQTE